MKQTAIDFLREKGILDSDKTKWKVNFSDGREFDIVELFEEYAKKNNILYVCTSGIYSEYGIDAIFDDKELAENYKNSFSKNIDIEEWDLNPHKDDLKNKRIPFFIRMTKDGKVEDIKSKDIYFNSVMEITFSVGRDSMVLYIFADNEEHAIKIANEKRFQILALDRWGQNDPLAT